MHWKGTCCANLQCRCKLIDKSRRQKHKPLSPLYESREKLRHAETEIYFTCGVRPIILAICHDDGWAFSTIWLFLIFVNTDLRNERIWGNGPSRLIFYNALILELKRLNYTGVSNYGTTKFYKNCERVMLKTIILQKSIISQLVGLRSISTHR